MFDSGLLIGDGFSELRIWLVEGVGLRLIMVYFVEWRGCQLQRSRLPYGGRKVVVYKAEGLFGVNAHSTKIFFMDLLFSFGNWGFSKTGTVLLFCCKLKE